MVSVLTNVSVIFTALLLIKSVYSQDSAQIDNLENLIKIESQKAADYILPSDARQFEATNKNVQAYGTFDFIIVGGGSSGSVIAKRLSTIGDWNILVIEAGKFYENGFIQIPRYSALQAFSDYNWGYKTVPQTGACLGTVNRTSFVHLGKGVGGSTLIRSATYNRGHPENYNNWAKTLFDFSWSYKNVVKYFKMSENFHWTNPKAPVDIQSHGTKGEWHVQHRTPDYYLNDVFVNANKELGYDITDYNSPSIVGSTIIQLYTRNGVKQDTGTAFLKPVLNRTNLKVLTESFVTKIEIDSSTRKAKGVVFTRDGKTYRAEASKEIILTAGAIASPKILMLSGIGPKNHLEKLGINVIQDLEVGSKLRDQVNVPGLVFTTNVTRPVDRIRDWIEDYLKGQGDLTGGGKVQAMGFYPECDNKKGVPKLGVVTDIASRSKMVQKFQDFTTEITDAFWGNNENAVSFVPELKNPKSYGTLRLKSKNPFEYPLINPKYLSDSNGEDIEALYKGIKLIFDLAKTVPYKGIDLKYLGNPIPGCEHLEFKSKDYWYCFIKHLTISGYQPTSTCPMGISGYQGGVVDSKMRVFGVKGLRVADASIFPTPITGNPVTASVMIGEKISNELLLEYFYY